MFLKQKIKLWFPVVTWCLVIFIFSSIPTLPTPKILWWDFILKKSAHVIEYGILYYLVFKAVKNTSEVLCPVPYGTGSLSFTSEVKKIKIITFIFCLIYALSDEYHQSFVPGRHAKLMDIGFDFLGMFFMCRWLKNRPHKEVNRG